MNPLLRVPFEIPFHEIRVEHIVPAVRELLAESQQNVDAIADFEGIRDFSNTLHSLDESTIHLENAMAVVRHLECVSNSPELREAIQVIDPEVSSFYSSIPLNPKLWTAIQAVSPDGLAPIEKRFLTKQVDAFRRHGAELEPQLKKRALAIDVELQALCTKFSQHVLDATNAFELMVDDESKLAGLPEGAVAAARGSAEAKGKTGYRFTLQAPSYLPVLTYLDNADIRRALW